MLDIALSHIFTSQWLVFFITLMVLAVAAELGCRFGLVMHGRQSAASIGQIGAIQAAILGLLALLLGFTFAMSVGRYEARRALVLDEANAIETTYLRAAFLPDDHKADVEDLLRRYVIVRLQFYGAGANRSGQAESRYAASEIQSELWAHAVAASKEVPTPLTATFVTALNETIDLDATRENALRTHVPGAVWLLLLIVAMSGCGVVGYSSGCSGVRSRFTNSLLPLLIAVVITLIADLDRPRGGLIGISQQPLLDAQQSLQPEHL
jgi:hypothetical protein